MRKLKYDYVVGTGGIGGGVLFQFMEDTTLGRNESRLARLMDTKDFCKLHIILHYIAVYTEKKIPIYAIGKVGNDSSGAEVLELMDEYGINCKYVSVDPDAKTMYSVCFLYPNSDGGNITTSNSASGNVAKEDIDRFFQQETLSGRGLVLAAPEVPLEIRAELLRQGRENGCFNVASFTSDEMRKCVELDILKNVDLLSINRHEMESLTGVIDAGSDNPAWECYEFLRKQNVNMQFIVTHGGEGVQLFFRGCSERMPAIWKPINSTAGAGDCFLATMISGLIYGVPFFENDSNVGLGGIATLAASIKVTCKDTIDFSLNRKRLSLEAEKMGIVFSDKVKRYFLEKK